MADTPAAALAGRVSPELVVLALTDAAAVAAVLDAAGGALAGRVVLNLTTAGPGEARAAAHAERLGARYVDGVVQGAPAQIGTSAALLLHAGAPEALGHVVNAAAQTAQEVADRTYPRGPASLTEYLPVLDRLVELRREQGMAVGRVAELREQVAGLIDQGHGADGFTRVVTGRVS